MSFQVTRYCYDFMLESLRLLPAPPSALQVPPEEVLPSVVLPAEVLQSEAEELPLPLASTSPPTLQDISTRR